MRRRTVAQHARLRSPHPIAQLLTVLAVAVVVVLVSAAGVAAYTAYDLTTSFTEEAVVVENQPPVPPDLSELEGGVNMMVVGIDACEESLREVFGERCEGPDAEGQLNDVNILVHISDAPRRVTVVSFPRDLQVAIPDCTREDGSVSSGVGKASINTAYEAGGLTCVADTVSDLSGQPIPFAAKVSFGNVVNITDAVGGVEVCIGGDGIDDYDAGIAWEPGLRVVKGYDALAFLRTRKGIGDGSDLARIGNQQQYLSRLLNKLRSDEVLSNPVTLIGLANTAVDNITPSESLADPLRLAQLGYTLKDVPLGDVTFVQYPVVDDPSDTNRVIPDDAAAAVLWDALARNAPLALTGEAGANGGVEIDPSQPQPAPVETTPAPDATTATPAPEVVELPGNVSGSKADQSTCSVGNG